MSAPELTEKERLAAEHALRLLEGEELLQARGLMANDPEFAAEVAQWEDKLSHLQVAQPPIAPGPELWARIESEIAGNRSADNDNVVSLQKSVRNWQFASIFSAAAAIALAFFAFPAMFGPGEQPATPDAPLMANIPIADTPLRLAVTYLPEREEILVSASGLTADGVHDHELWLVADDGAKSLGVVVPGEERRVAIDPTLASLITDGSQMVLTREPLGGAPKGGEAGPVVAQGQFTQI
ncbi:anti-sigma factor [Pontixanthobacter sp. CEM42]|uniref:anti-sigma factor n=1 Tax=Pontixanthobacter sp. CEM42 TaxID=2792077 RepID=UPI001ADF7732|nr:anti-sigma factor [Pontixanthobacter sp. CEM42]